MKHNHQFTPYTKINSRWIKDLHISGDTIKALEDNIGRKTSGIPCSNIFTNTSLKARDINEKINKWDLIEFKSFCTAKRNSSEMKRETTVWENIFTNDTSEKGLISEMYKELTSLQEDTKPNEKMGKRLEQPLLQGGQTECPETYEKMLSITSYLRDANKNHSEISLHASQNGHPQQIDKQQVMERMWRKRNHTALLVGMQTGTATVEHSMEFPQKTNNGTAF